MKGFIKIIMLVAACAMGMLTMQPAYAAGETEKGIISTDFGDFNDFGDFSDFDFDWDSDWGSDIGDLFDDYDFNYDYDYDDSYDYYNDYDSYDYYDDYDYYDGISSAAGVFSCLGCGLTFGGIFVFAAIIIVVIIIIINVSRKKPAKPNRNTMHGAMNKMPNRTGQIEAIIKQHDPAFSSSDLITFAKNSFVDIQMAWSGRDLRPVMGILHTDLYEQTNLQIQKMIENGIVNKIEGISVNTAYISAYVRDRDYEYVNLYLNARMIDYQINETTGEIIRGNKSTRWDMYYRIKLMRAYGVKTRAADGDEMAHKCPNCGANLTLNANGQCEYCDSFITSGKHSWVISDFGTIRPDTVDEGIRE